VDICRSRGIFLKGCVIISVSVLKRQFSQRLRRLQEWAKKHVEPETVRQKLLNLKAKSAKFQKAYDFPDAYRTLLYS